MSSTRSSLTLDASAKSARLDLLLAMLAGLSASLVGIGLARFAYTPLIPPLIQAHWFAASDVLFLSAANLLGYLAGALSARPLARRWPQAELLRWAMAVTALAFFACAWPVSTAWFFAWRFISGWTGGVIMVLVASCLLPHVPPARRGLASGAIFLGAGLGILASGTLVPLLLRLGLRQTWLGLGALALALTVVTWRAWPGAEAPHAAASGSAPAEPTAAARRALNRLYLQYGLMAVGLAPMMVFLVDHVARGLGWGLAAGTDDWVLYGLGAIAGPMAYGALADRVGGIAAGRWAVAGQLLAVALLLAAPSPVPIGLAALLLGSYPPGIPVLMLGRVHQALPGQPAAQHAAWGRATIVFALLQALAGYGYSALAALRHGDHHLSFAIAGLALVAILLLDIGARRREQVQ